MEKLRLKKGVKKFLAIITIGVFLITFVRYCTDRFEKINNGEIIVVSESQMAERN